MDEIWSIFLIPLFKRAIRKLDFLYHDWNEKINGISRKDIDALYTNILLELQR
jgi:16S rRNA (guanine527-N7)-methyltransferase